MAVVALLATTSCEADGGEQEPAPPALPSPSASAPATVGQAQRSAAEADATRSLGCAASTRRAMASAVPGEPVPTGPDVEPEPVSARPVGAFLNSVGVNIHATYTNTPYADHDRLLEVLRQSGFRHVRDGLVPGREEEQEEFLARLGAQGGCAQLILGGEDVDEDQLDDAVDVVSASVDTVAGVEGPNELDLTDRDDWEELAEAQQRAIHSVFLDGDELIQVPVAGPSVGRPGSFSAPGDLSDVAQLANLHPYPGGDPPEGEITPHRMAAESMSGDAPVVVTETGYHDALEDESSQPGVPEDVEAVYLPRLLLDAFDIGVARTYLYELVDEFPDDDDDQASFGLYRRDWSPKPAAKSVTALLDLLGSRPSTDARDLDVAVRAPDGDELRTVLLSDDEGFWVALWQPASVYDYDDDAYLDVEPVSASVVLGDAADATVYHPVEGRRPVTRSTDARSVDVQVGAAPVLVRLEP